MGRRLLSLHVAREGEPEEDEAAGRSGGGGGALIAAAHDEHHRGDQHAAPGATGRAATAARLQLAFGGGAPAVGVGAARLIAEVLVEHPVEPRDLFVVAELFVER